MGDFEFNGVPFTQSSVSSACDCRVVDKYVGATFVPDEAVTFGIIEPFDLALHVVSLSKCSSPRTAVFCCFNTLLKLFYDIDWASNEYSRWVSLLIGRSRQRSDEPVVADSRIVHLAFCDDGDQEQRRAHAEL